MKHVYLISLALLVSCGVKHETKYIETPFDNSTNEARLAELENKVAAIELNIKANISAMNNLTNSIQTLELELEQTNTENNDELRELIDTNTAVINSLQAQVTSSVAQLVTLQSQNSIIEYLDPCGDKANAYDEIILKTSQGEFIAYFEQGGNRFLSKLDKNVLYQTTDNQACRFTINNEGELV